MDPDTVAEVRDCALAEAGEPLAVAGFSHPPSARPSAAS